MGSLSGGTPTYTNNYANDALSGTSDASGKDGESVALGTTQSQVWWTSTAGWSGKFGSSESVPWVWDDTRPKLWFE
jgi:hypothetical protein